MAWVTSSDVTASWIGEDAPTDTALIDLWVGRAERLVRNTVPDLQSRLDAEADLVPAVTDLLETAQDVVVQMVLRLFRNPEGIRSVNTTTGPFSENRTYAGSAPGGLFIEDTELAMLQDVSAPGQAYTVDLTPLPVTPAAEPAGYWTTVRTF